MGSKINLNDYDLIVFDNDGVILNIVEAVRQASHDGIEKFKIEKNPDEALAEIASLIEKVQAIPIPKTILNAKEILNPSFLEKDATVLKRMEIAIYIYSKYRKYFSDAVLYDGVKKTLDYLKEKGKKIAMLTNNRSSSAKKTLEKLGVVNYFNPLIGFEEAKKLKPEPDGLLKILEMEGIKPEKALFIGDMTSDIICGKRANVKTICVASGLVKKEILNQGGAFMVVDTMIELAQAFGLKI